MTTEEIVDVPAVDVPAKKPWKRPAVLAGAAVVTLVCGGLGAFAYQRMESPSEGHEEVEAAKSSSYVEVPPLIVNLRGGSESRFLKLRFIAVAANDETADEVKAKLPVVLDALQPFLRELRPEDLDGSAAVYRIKEEMMRRTNDAIGPDKVTDILIQDLVQQ